MFRFLTRIAPTLLAPLALVLVPSSSAQLPDAPSALFATALPHNFPPPSASDSTFITTPEPYSSNVTDASLEADPDLAAYEVPQTAPQAASGSSTTAPTDKPRRNITADTGTQPHRILGLMPNYRSVSAGEIPPPPGFKQSFKIATRQAFDYSSFVFLGMTTASAYWQGSHPSLNTYNGGDAVFWAYLWRGFLDKTDGTYQSAWILPTLLHEDTRYYAMGHGSKWKRLGYAMSRVAVARTYEGHATPNLAGLGGKIGAQAVSHLLSARIRILRRPRHQVQLRLRARHGLHRLPRVLPRHRHPHPPPQPLKQIRTLRVPHPRLPQEDRVVVSRVKTREGKLSGRTNVSGVQPHAVSSQMGELQDLVN